MPTEQTLLVGEVSAEFFGWRVPRSQRDGSLRLYSRLSRPKPLLLVLCNSLIVFTRLSGPRSRPTTPQKMWLRRESNHDNWICSQDLWPLDHRGGKKYVIIIIQSCVETGGSVVGWGSMSQVTRPRVRFPIRSFSSCFNLPKFLQPHYAPNVDSASKRNGRHKIFLGVMRGWQHHRHVLAKCLENAGSSTSHNLMGLHGLLQG
jgi:hypothetical protein